MSDTGKPDNKPDNKHEEPHRSRTGILEATLVELRRIAEETIDARFDGNQTKYAEAIGVTPPSMSRFLAGGGLNLDTAVSICLAGGYAPVDVLRHDLRLGEGAPSTTRRRTAPFPAAVRTPYPNLEVAVMYEGDTHHWPEQIVEACRRGLVPGPDVSPKEWTRRLDVISECVDAGIRKLTPDES